MPAFLRCARGNAKNSRPRASVRAPQADDRTKPRAPSPGIMQALPPTPTRALIVDDQLLVRAGVAALLEAMPEWQCVGTAASPEAAVQACLDERPDLVLLDLHLPSATPAPQAGAASTTVPQAQAGSTTAPQELEGIGLARTLLSLQPRLRILVLSGRTQPEVVRAALRAGACGFIGKDFVHEELQQALHSVVAGHRWLSPALAAALRDQERTTPALTGRQRDVLTLLARGQSNKQIARSLGVSVKTVEYHRAELIARLDLHDVASLTRFAVAQGLAS
jgi:DNA-binding NarL/FixJ family response regulator